MHCNDGAARSGITVAADLFLYVVDHNQVIESNFESFLVVFITHFIKKTRRLSYGLKF